MSQSLAIREPLAPDGSANYGWVVGIGGGRLVIGAPEANAPAFSAGVVDLYERNPSNPTQWRKRLRLGSSDVDGFEDFGRASAISREIVVVGDPLDDVRTTQIGSAHVFQPTLPR